MRALVTGAEGQLGRALVERLGGGAAWAGGRAQLDVRDGAAVERLVRDVRPAVIFNAAAYNAVDRAESEPGEAFAVNSAGPAHLARVGREVGALLVHVSTDYVFSGADGRAYAEDDLPAPLSVYGVSKLAGELAVRAASGEHLVVRTSGVFGGGGSRAKGGSFVERILAKARAGEALRVVDDQVFAPTYAPDLAAALVALVERGVRGVVHAANAGSCSWHALASAALELAGLARPVAAVHSAELHLAARRPVYSVLSTARYEALGLPPLRPWRDALAAFLATLREAGQPA